MITTIISFIIILGVLVLVHELGHFWMARRFGCKVDEFGFGFPPRITGFRRKKDGPEGTLYSINWLPLGGFVKIKGEQGDSAQDSDSFAHKKAWQRMVILAAGVVMNVLLCVVLLSIGYVIGVPQSLEGVSSQARVRDHRIHVMEVLKGSPAEQAGVEAGESVESKEAMIYDSMGEPGGSGFVVFQNIKEIQDYFNDHVGQAVTLKLLSPDAKSTRTLEITPQLLLETNRGGIGVSLVETGVVSYPVYLAPVKGVESTALLTKQIVLGFGGLIKDLVVKREVSVDITGPVGIAVLTGRVVEQGAVYILYFAALLSLNLAFINFLPIPALDGGRFLFVIIEKIRRRPVDQRIEGIIHMIGFTLLLGLVLLVTVRDVSNLTGGLGAVWEKITH